MEKASKAISYVFHPLLVPSLGILVLFNSGTYLSYLPVELKSWMLVFTFLSTYLIPMAAIYFLYYQGIIKSMHVRSREERYAPLIISLIMYVFCYYLVHRIDAPKLYNAFLFSSLVSIIFTLLATLRFKISIHMVGMGGLTALVAFLAFHLRVNLMFYLILAVLLAGLIGSARLILKAHSPGEVYSGYLLGLATVLITMVFY